jgi:serine/threonine protein kinase/formylglycine-generating enzyme required for sulfatase activity
VNGGGSPFGQPTDPLSELKAFLGRDPSRENPGAAIQPSSAGGAEGKYEVEREIGRGGMGRVLMAFDRNIRRRIAVKVIQSHLGGDPGHLARFIEEAQVTGQLEHPGIPPIHELGINPEGEVFFTMKLVRGRTLKEIIRDLHIGRRDVRERYGLKRLLAILQAVANAVHFAHEKGVIHRDIKPENIMVGDYGEVQLMDWGLAKIMRREGQESSEEQVETLRSGKAEPSEEGFVQGTLHYMAPEQAQGRNDLVDQRSDVYALGSTLYEILTYQHPLAGETMKELLSNSRLGLTTPPRERAPKQNIPAPLEEICQKAMEYHPDDRYQTALELAEDLQVFLDGTREEEHKRSEGERLLAEARKVLRDHDLEKRRLEALRREADDLRRAAMGSSPRPEERRRERELRSSMEGKAIEVATLYTHAQTLLSSALKFQPENGATRRLLAELYLERFLQADHEGKQADLIFYRGLIEQVNDGSLDRVLRGDGSLAIETTPGGASMALFVYREVEGGLRADREVWRGTGPVSLPEVPMGSFLLSIEREGCAPTHFPVLVRRNQEVRAMVKLYPQSKVPPGFAYIPEGPFLYSGDPRAPSAMGEPDLRSLEGFALAVHPVTCGEYREFLDDLSGSDPDEAWRRSPRESAQSGHHWLRGADGRFSYPPGARYPFQDRLPVFGISFEDARAYCQWRSGRDGVHYDLPSEVEWEKAARGVDGRFFAWGNSFETTFCNNYSASDSRRGIAPVDDFPEDSSPYGVRGMTGNVGDLCYDAFDSRPDVAGLRGGNWALTEDACRLAVRRQVLAGYVSDRIGFRLKLVL